MAKKRTPVTPAIRFLRGAKIPFEEHLYDYEDRGGTRKSAAALGVDEHMVIKTLVMQDDEQVPLIVLMHGDEQVSEKALARQLGKKHITACTPETAQRHTGYMVGGTSPFGTKKKLPIYAEATIFGLQRIYINGGKRGFLVSLEPKPALDSLGVCLVSVKAG